MSPNAIDRLHFSHMILASHFAKLLDMDTFLSVGSIDNSITGLDSSIKTFIAVVAILGPMSIAGIIVLLKKIEKKSPDRIRWR